eukprot:5664811-Prymnesium_polylepis.1
MGGTDEEGRRMNAKYAISSARKLGCSVFVLWEDIVDVRPTMVLSLSPPCHLLTPPHASLSPSLTSFAGAPQDDPLVCGRRDGVRARRWQGQGPSRFGVDAAPGTTRSCVCAVQTMCTSLSVRTRGHAAHTRQPGCWEAKRRRRMPMP